MRVEFQKKLRDFNAKLSAFQKHNADFIGKFVRENVDNYGNCFDPLLLSQYHDGVFVWLGKWARQFYVELAHVPSFHDDSSQLTDACIERNCSRLKLFIAGHAHDLPVGITDITLSPFMPAHRVLVLAAEMVVTPDESVCRLFFPEVEKIIGFPTEGVATDVDVKCATEVDEVFPAHLFLTQGKNTLISLVDYLNYVTTNDDVAKEYIGNRSRRNYLYSVFGAPFNNYSNVLIYLAMKRISDPSRFAFHVTQFSAALHEKSVEATGKEYDAGKGYEDVILKFYRLWRTLDPDIKKTIAKTRLGNDKYVFEDYILAIFVTIPFSWLISRGLLRSDEVLKKSKFDRERKNGIVRCCNTISNTASAFVSENRQWAEIKVSETIAVEESIYNTSDVERCREVFLSSLRDKQLRLWRLFPKMREALMPTDKNQQTYQRFFNIADLIFIFSDSHLLFCLKNNCSEIFSTPSQVLYFIYKNTTLPRSFWDLFCNEWVALFKKMEDVITLFYIIDDESVFRILLPLFKSALTEWFSTDNFNINLLYKNCKYFQFLPQTVLCKFIETMIRLNPECIIDIQGLLRCISPCTTEQQLQDRFCLIQNRITIVLSPENENRYGINLLNYIKLLSGYFETNPALFNSVVVPTLEGQISQLLLWKKIDALYNACFSGCFSAFFSLKKMDEKLYKTLSDITDSELKTPFEKNKEVISVLGEFLRAHKEKDTVFSRAIRHAFAPDFFDQLDGFLSSHLSQSNAFAGLTMSFGKRAVAYLE